MQRTHLDRTGTPNPANQIAPFVSLQLQPLEARASHAQAVCLEVGTQSCRQRSATATEDSQASVVDFRQRGQFGANAVPEPTPTAVGTVVTRRGAFDASLSEDVWSDDEVEASPPASNPIVESGGGGETPVDSVEVGGEVQRSSGDAALERALTATATADRSV
ncbi:hypothetical protein PR003_g2458 [Phytophthora rubi]|uniref:Uncharacterized protein n=1 Tax=Phytophthora rubi TaxID=129364 RepID=A0A6A3PD51_9STRA|nr:hypothetical protein PR001_g2456 [Phytophthora rubi]KAE9356170.1 hypothetical protein PR003_g2458 [Phytophthora rubi]